MPHREVKIYDRDFPATARMMVGDPTVKDDWPQEVWKAAVGKDEFAVVFRHFKTDNFLMPDSRPGKQGTELCLVFDNLDEARTYSRQLVKRSAYTICFIYKDNGDEVEQIRNNKALNQFGAASLVGILVWLMLLCAIGVGIIFAAYEFFLLMIDRPLPEIGSYRLWSWVLFCAAGLLCGLAAYLGVQFLKVKSHIKAIHKKITREEWDRYGEELNKLQGSSNPEDHARYKALFDEMQRKLGS
jgi:hypothetical protein